MIWSRFGVLERSPCSQRRGVVVRFGDERSVGWRGFGFVQVGGKQSIGLSRGGDVYASFSDVIFGRFDDVDGVVGFGRRALETARSGRIELRVCRQFRCGFGGGHHRFAFGAGRHALSREKPDGRNAPGFRADRFLFVAASAFASAQRLVCDGNCHCNRAFEYSKARRRATKRLAYATIGLMLGQIFLGLVNLVSLARFGCNCCIC